MTVREAAEFSRSRGVSKTFCDLIELFHWGVTDLQLAIEFMNTPIEGELK